MLFESLVTESDGRKRLRRDSFDALPRALKRRLLEMMIGRLRDRGAAIDEVLDSADPPAGGKELRFSVASGTEVTLGAGSVDVQSAEEQEDA
jgi:hypothetical protein